MQTLVNVEVKMERIKEIIEIELTGEFKSCTLEIIEDYYEDMLTCIGSDAPTDHHGYVGGWITHTLGVLENAVMICNMYPFLHRQLMVMGAILHDLGKLKDYTLVGNTFEHNSSRYLLGHCAEGVSILSKYLEKYNIEKHLKDGILHIVGCHMGSQPSASIMQPVMPEAIFLNFADHMDALAEPVREAKEKTQIGDWTDYVVGTAERKLYIV
ncbi:MAG: HD domain-containing protein [Clostridia bacterium]|jgi:3'-5' exoribonuclease|nr:HD domain-containing protein [Clostridia bacterium]